MPKRALEVPATKNYELEEVYRELVVNKSTDGSYVRLEDIKRRMCERFEERRRDYGTKA